MGKIKINGIKSKENKIKDSMAQAFQNLLTNSRGWRTNIKNLSFDGLGAQDVAMLEASPLKEKVFITLFIYG